MACKLIVYKKFSDLYLHLEYDHGIQQTISYRTILYIIILQVHSYIFLYWLERAKTVIRWLNIFKKAVRRQLRGKIITKMQVDIKRQTCKYQSSQLKLLSGNKLNQEYICFQHRNLDLSLFCVPTDIQNHAL